MAYYLSAEHRAFIVTECRTGEGITVLFEKGQEWNVEC